MAHAVVPPETAVGFVPQQAYHGGLTEDVNLFNFNLVATLPLSPSYPVSETLSYGLTAYYNGGLAWLAYHDPNGAWRSGYNVTDENSWLGVGWRLDFGKIVNFQSGNCSVPGSSIFNSWLAPGGFMHEFPFGQSSTIDGSEIAIVDYVLRASNPDCMLPTRLHMDHFRLYRNIDPNSGQVTRIEDNWGNGVDVTYMEPSDFLAIDPTAPASSYDYSRPAPPGVVYPEVTKAIKNVSDSFGRQILTTMTRIPVADRFQLTDVATPVFGDTPGSPSGHWSLVYEVRQITQPPVGWPSMEPGQYPDLPFLVRLELPADASGTRLTYTFDYNSSGELSEIRTASGARTVYTWGNEYIAAGDRIVNNPAYDPPRARVIASKTVYPTPYDSPTTYTWSYVHNRFPSSGCSFAFGNDPWRAIVTDPEGNDTEYRFYGKVNDTGAPEHYGLPGAVKFYKGQALRWKPGMSSFDSASVDPAFPGTGQLLREVYYRPNSLIDGAYFFNRSTQTIYFDDRVNPAGSSMDPNGAWLQGWASACYAEREMNLPAGDPMFEGWAWHAETHDPNTLIGFSGYTPYESSYTGNLVGPSTLQILGDMNCNPLTSLFPNRIVKVGGVAKEYTQWSWPYCYKRFDPTRNYLIPPDRDTLFNHDVQFDLTYTAGRLTSFVHSGGDAVSTDPNATSPLPAPYTEQMTYAAGALQSRKFTGTTWYAKDHTIDTASALPLASRDTAGVQTGSTYDALGRLIAVTPVSPEQPTTIMYPAETFTDPSFPNIHRFSRRAEVLKGPSTADPEHLYARYDYDGLGRVSRVIRRHADGTLVQQTHTYDGLDAPTFTSEWHLPSESNPPGTTISYRDGDTAFPPAGRRDPFGRPHRITDASGATREITYFGLNEVATLRNLNGDPAQVAVTKTYRDFRGNVRVVDAPEGADALYEYDHADRLTRVRLVPSFSWPTYDDPATTTSDLRADRLAVVLPGGTLVQERTFTRDALGNLRQSVEPEKGINRYHAYDTMGNLLLSQDNTGRLSRLTRDAAGRATMVEIAVDPNNPQYKKRERYTFVNGSATGYGQALSRLIRAETFEGAGIAPTATREFIYSELNGRLSEEKTRYNFWSFTPPWLSTRYSWNTYGLLDHLTYPVEDDSPRPATELDYSYLHGFLSEVRSNKETPDPMTFTPLVTASYGISGAPQSLSFSNGVVESTTFDTAGRVSNLQVSHPPDPTLWSSGSYAYDGAGNLTGIGPQVFAYDRIGRLTSAGTSSPDPNSSVIYSQNFAYDLYGSMDYRSGGPMGNQDFVLDPNRNRLVKIGPAGVSFSYTANGSVGADHLYDYVYNDREQLINVRVRGEGWDLEGYAYDDRGWRTRKTDNTANRLTAYIRGQDGLTLTEYAAPSGTFLSPHWKKDYVYAFGRHIAAIENTEPEVPAGVTSEASDPGTPALVSLAWTPVPAADIYGYVVLRTSMDPNNTYQRLTPVPITTPDYTDTQTTLGYPYFYKLISVDTASMESRETAPRKITPGDAVPPETVSNLEAEGIPSGVLLMWTPAADPGGDLAGYRVLRRLELDPPSALTDLAGVLSMEASSYLDTTAQAGNSYLYVVRSHDTAGKRLGQSHDDRVHASWWRRGRRRRVRQSLSAAGAASSTVSLRLAGKSIV
jgi:YD repeat-containing protein